MPMNSAFFYRSEQPERQPGNSPTPTTPLGGVGGVGERHSPVPSPSDADREERAMAVRKAFPVCAAAAAEFAAVFPGTRMVFASEDGREIGRRGPDGVPPVLSRLPAPTESAPASAGMSPRRDTRNVTARRR